MANQQAVFYICEHALLLGHTQGHHNGSLRFILFSDSNKTQERKPETVDSIRLDIEEEPQRIAQTQDAGTIDIMDIPQHNDLPDVQIQFRIGPAQDSRSKKG